LIGRIPVEWDAVPLKSVSEFVTSGSRGWAQYYSIEGALFLRISNLTRDHINMRFDDVVRVTPPKSSEGRRTSVSAGDLLISITADLGIIGVIPDGFQEAYVNQHIALVRVDGGKANPRFLGWFLSSRRGQTQFDQLNESGAKAGLNLPTIERLTVPTTTAPDEQRRIAEVLDAATRETDETLRNLEKLRRLKSGLMQDLLTGRKRVTPLLAVKAELAAQV
jgi:type I restriction enzyme S subunit